MTYHPAFDLDPDCPAPIPAVLVGLALASYRSTRVSLAPLPAFYPVYPVHPASDVIDLDRSQWSPVEEVRC
ncbi:hypothetical protein [Falsirhodobacter sp. 20TX0035]|uniref:hypothetical protein n=1 Tax=Falsirhodobacter sp. 20TX0035 TaxID=3022019 RepID=UPI00232E4C06|nr:hypothetical protein [Falsirhodobacter sp. 20TX0035]MDB6454736.1 hypothetical protein [Falsirhodobacter sp. 20TX0035]